MTRNEMIERLDATKRLYSPEHTVDLIIEAGIVKPDQPKPATIPEPGEIPIEVPHTDVWPMDEDEEISARASLVWHFYDTAGRCIERITAKHGSITRDEAEVLHEHK